ncbi:MAG: NAD(P)/FAD-dependent oxidoreductase [Proteobacteria bacterium]|nr:NAD(P)/FAD-dependent oxidoreductase [Pseudomonadota bacterium]
MQAVAHPSAPLQADAVVIGAGPVGLFQVFQLGLQGIAVHLIDALPRVGGQCDQLYPDKPIYDIPGIPVCTGQELVALLERQIAPFAPTRHLGQRVDALAVQEDGRFLLRTTAGASFLTKSVFIAAGVGAFMPRSLKVDGLAAFLGSQLLYHPADVSAARGHHVVVHGGDEAAVQAAIACVPAAASVTLLHRRDVFCAAPEPLAELQALRAAGRIHVTIGQITGVQQSPDGCLQALELTGPDGGHARLPLTLLLAYLGLTPRLGPIADWGLAMERKQLAVDPASFVTNVAGIYAVGDINSYPGKRKLILCGFHEATLAAFAEAERQAGQKLPLEYTTSSDRLQARLGVAGAA